MIIQCAENIEQNELAILREQIKSFGLKVTEVATQVGRYLIALGSYEVDIRRIGGLKGVKDVHRVSDAYKLVSRKWKVAPTVIDLGDGVRIGDGDFAFMFGPCSLESAAQFESVVEFLNKNGVRIMRGGAFKPRSSPYAFRGLGIEGLKMFSEIARPHGIKLTTEVMDAAQIEAMYPYVDVYQVGTRNAQNFTLLDELGKIDKPVLLKRAMSGTIEELLQAAEYIFMNGNERILLCERGIRTYEKAYRNTLDINAIPVLKEKTHLPVIVDPSHGIGVRRHVEAIALAGLVAGADGAIVEIHETPEKAASDAAQTLNFSETEKLLKKAKAITAAMKSV
ncbi:MAG TPA: bifunctional 3-deoxy-7-phosphoheptulonate synthase/chorismate mutase, partial [Pyrinomonadaceae bacterium]|nr:bifunctional 3-deoxy-7-phosphoheptulonate synthase/chorismate mutase [Pyrinomonadaceae bacterium]